MRVPPLLKFAALFFFPGRAFRGHGAPRTRGQRPAPEWRSSQEYNVSVESTYVQLGSHEGAYKLP